MSFCLYYPNEIERTEAVKLQRTFYKPDGRLQLAMNCRKKTLTKRNSFKVKVNSIKPEWMRTTNKHKHWKRVKKKSRVQGKKCIRDIRTHTDMGEIVCISEREKSTKKPIGKIRHSAHCMCVLYQTANGNSSRKIQVSRHNTRVHSHTCWGSQVHTDDDNENDSDSDDDSGGQNKWQ